MSKSNCVLRLRIVADNPELAAQQSMHDETITAIATALTSRGVDKLHGNGCGNRSHCWTQQGVTRLEYAHQSAAYADVARCFTCFSGYSCLSYAPFWRQTAGLLSSNFFGGSRRTVAFIGRNGAAKPHCYGSRLGLIHPTTGTAHAHPNIMAILGNFIDAPFCYPGADCESKPTHACLAIWHRPWAHRRLHQPVELQPYRDRSFGNCR